MAETRTVTLHAAGERLDRALAEALPEWSRAQWQRLIKEEQVVIGGRPITRGSYRTAEGEVVRVTLPAVVETELVAEAIPLDVRYEDENLLVLNKPAGMVVHPAAGHERGTLVNAILAHCPDLPGVGGEKRPGIVHRLDKETSGLIIVAKNDATLRGLQNQFKRRTVAKVYLALVEGAMQPAQALIDAPIGRDPKQRKRMAVIAPGSSAQSRPAQTKYQVKQFYEGYTLVECHPLTGRTHQIRVHLAFAGYPIVGDTVYGRRKPSLPLKRHFLHAAELTFKRPADGVEMTLVAELPSELGKVLARLEEG
jgi:23S rRNA pseudouridine1911/1915/1917 synthase